MEKSAYGPILFYYNNDPNKPVRKVFISRVIEECVERTVYGCMIWIGSLDGYNKPQMTITHNTNDHGHVSVNRLMFQYEYGSISANVRIYRRCENVLCINPRHYYVKIDGG